MSTSAATAAGTSGGLSAAVAGARAGLFIDGKEHQPLTGRWFPSYDPCTTEPWYEIADAGVDDVDLAVRAAERAYRQGGWGRTLGVERATILHALAAAVERYADEFGDLETRENGKLLRETSAQARSVARAFRYHAGMADKLDGSTPTADSRDTLSLTLREPYGVIGVIVPWNSPISLLTSTAAPALAAGNTLVVKPSEDASASVLAFARIAVESGLPPGVLNVVTGRGPVAGQALVAHPGVGKVAFTGGGETGRAVARAAADRLTPVLLELGGKSAHILLDDADLDRAVPGVVAGIFAAAGQTCVAGSRCLVQRSIYDDVVDRLRTLTEDIVIGDPREPATQLGPLASARQLEKVTTHVEWALADGATLLTGGEAPPAAARGGAGWFYRPTVFTGVTAEMRLFQEEIFGPVLGLVPFDTDEEALALANATRYGLAAGVWTENLNRALRFGRGLESGTVWVNTYRAPATTVPSGGYKESGYGRLNGVHAVDEFTREKSLIVDHSGAARDPFVMKLGD